MLRRKWGPHFTIQFTAKLLKAVPEDKCYDLIKIEDMTDKHFPSYTKVTYCSKGQNFTFQQSTDNDIGRESITFQIQKVNKKEIFKMGANWAGYVKFDWSHNGTNFYKDSAKYFIDEESKNSAETKEAKIEISAVKSYMKISDLVITEDEQKEPKRYISGPELGPEW